MTISPPVRELIANVSIPFEQARAMPPSVYTSEDFLKAELENVFAREWVSVGRADSLKNAGDYLTYELAGQPIIVLRDNDGRLRAMPNVCLHRMSTLLEGSGNKRAIVCPYHGWTYNLDGSLRAAPAMELNSGFRKQDYKLASIRCEEWLGWIMVTLDRDAKPVAEELADVRALIDDFGMEGYVESFRETHIWNTNWKILAENFMESYHLPVCHAGTIGGLSRFEDMICPPGRRTFNYHTILKDDSLKIALAHPDNQRLIGDRRRTTFLLCVYPSLLVTLTPGIFLVSLPASAWAGAGAPHLWRRPVARLRPRAGRAGILRQDEDAARHRPGRGSRLHGEGLSRPELEGGGRRPSEPSRAAELRFRAISRRTNGRFCPPGGLKARERQGAFRGPLRKGGRAYFVNLIAEATVVAPPPGT